jgi:glycosyltransferase involved in cell wall biosynthesis
VPTYNRRHLIGETIQSVIDQSYKNWELIIVDDGSTDDTKRKIEEFKNDRIRYFFIEHRGVIGAVRNNGINYARGEFIAFLDSDDLWQPDKLNYQLSLLKEFPQASFVFGHGEQFGKGATPTPELEKSFVGNVFLPFLFEERFIFYVPTLLFKKEILYKIKTIDESLFYAGDIDFFLRMAYTFEGIFNHTIVARIRKQEQSHSQSNELNAYDEYLLMLKKHFRESRLTSKQFSRLALKHHYKVGLLYLSYGKSKRATKEFQSHIRLNPLGWKGWIRLVQSFLKIE